jgi:hypothetical protein
MSNDDPQVTAARIEVERTRARMMETKDDLQARLKPSTLAHSAWDGAKEKGTDAVEAARRRPLAAGGIAAALALYLVRKPLKSLAGKFRNGNDGEHSDDGEEFEIEEIAIIGTEKRND